MQQTIHYLREFIKSINGRVDFGDNHWQPLEQHRRHDLLLLVAGGTEATSDWGPDRSREGRRGRSDHFSKLLQLGLIGREH
jgi:hypothetical protein